MSTYVSLPASATDAWMDLQSVRRGPKESDPYAHLGGTEEAHRIAHYFSYLQDELLLTDRAVTLCRTTPATEDAVAEIDYSHWGTYVNLYISSDWPTRTPEEKRHFLVHEAMHLVTEKGFRWLPTKRQAKKQWGKMTAECMDDDQERVVDHLALAVGPLLHPWGRPELLGDRKPWTTMED